MTNFKSEVNTPSRPSSSVCCNSPNLFYVIMCKNLSEHFNYNLYTKKYSILSENNNNKKNILA